MLAAMMKAQVRNVRCLATPLLAGRELWAARQVVGRYARHAAFSAQGKKASVRIASAPSHDDADVPSNVLTESDDEFWYSAKGQVRDQAFVFELDPPEDQLFTRVEWRTCDQARAVAGLLLEAKVGEEWRDVARVASRECEEWQSHDLVVWLQSKHWRVTFTHNHGDPDWMCVCCFRFMGISMKSADHLEVMTSGLWSRMAYADAEVISGNFSSPVHRAVLVASSSELEAMVKEADGQHKREIHLIDVGAQSAEDFLAYLYTGRVSFTADFGLLVLGVVYNITGLVERAGPVALSNVRPENVLASVRMLRNHTHDARAEMLWKLLEQKVRENPDLLRPILRET